jgi:DNA helicase-2/ATP-dependent DNA helicase PcrA
MLVKLLSQASRRLCVVGDDDQSIYGFRGADIRNILEFERDFPEAKVVRLEQNYRSTRTILECANQVVKHNLGRKGKNLWTEGQQGEPVTRLQSWDERDEAERICRTIKSRGESFNHWVVLYRTNAQSRALEESMRRHVLPYLIVGGVKFYERKEVKDLLAYLKVLANPADSVSLRRIINEPARGIGDTSLMRLDDFAGQQELTLYQALGRAGEVEGLGPAVKAAILGFLKLTEDLRAQSRLQSAEQVLKSLIENIGYLKHLQGLYPDPEEATSRAENVQELAAAANEFCDRSEDKALPAFLAEVSLVADIDRWDEKSEAVTLMTMHNAKGLEFDRVFIAGLEEGLLPHSASMESRQELEEERRLFYVAITRAKKELFLSLASSRRRYGGLMPSAPSRFLKEIPRELLKVQGEGPAAGRQSHNHDITVDDEPRERSLKGQQVSHSIWGRGRIVEVEGQGEEMKLCIVFPGGIKKKVLASYVELD